MHVMGETGAIDLTPSGASASTARQFVAATLLRWDLSDLLDAVELATSELVTNAVLHARTGIRLEVVRDGDGVRIQVSDDSDALPVQRTYGGDATTGRGLSLVHALAREVGVEVSRGGKTVWFTIHRDDVADDVASAAAELEAWVPPEPDPDGPPPVAEHVVRLVDVPVALTLAAQQHHEGALRELVLYQRVSRSTSEDAWTSLAPSSRALAVLAETLNRAVLAAISDGLAVVQVPSGHPAAGEGLPVVVDVVVPLSPTLGADLVSLQDTLDEADRLAADGLLLLRPSLPDVVAVRDWCCEQIIAQLAGGPAAPWKIDHAALEDTAGARMAPATWDPAQLHGATAALIAADDRNRILAVSPAAAALLGWDIDELVGRRIVTIVPDRFREAHIAGFTRHLVTGETRVLGVELHLPVLCGDGSEVEVRLLIDRVPAGNRVVYVARLDRVPDT